MSLLELLIAAKKTKLMLYSTLVKIEVEVGVELGNKIDTPPTLDILPEC